jgi:hypothetical protein
MHDLKMRFTGWYNRREGLRLFLFGYESGRHSVETAAKAGAAPWREVAASYRRCLYMKGEKTNKKRTERQNGK